MVSHSKSEIVRVREKEGLKCLAEALTTYQEAYDLGFVDANVGNGYTNIYADKSTFLHRAYGKGYDYGRGKL